MARALPTRTNMAVTTTRPPRIILSIISGPDFRTRYEDREDPEALPHRKWKALPPEGSRSRRHTRSEIRRQARRSGTSGAWSGRTEAFAGHAGGAGPLGTSDGAAGSGCVRQG